MKKSFLIALLFMVLIITGCGEKTWVKQKVGIDSRINCTYSVTTYLWYGNRLLEQDIEKVIYKFRVKKIDIDRIKADQLEEMQPIKEKLIEALKNDCK